ncbi:MAG: sodium:solute symporter [Candidatus Omnitrophica bacterium]|nr:sodium:solute symporter [Candidatus Omnitrophota bacterium]MCA9437515.1 sodium:solute symporter [Candidatus Omnitrophota bacterium]
METQGIESALTWIDWSLLFVYFGFVIWLGSHFGKKQTSSEHYFLGGRNLPGWAVGISIFATIISSWAFLGLPGKSFKDDIQFLMSIVPIPIAMWVCTKYFIPLFRNKVKLSAYEYLERRFGLFARFYGNIAFISGHIFKMGVVLMLMCKALGAMTGWNVDTLIVLIGLATITYTFFGGIEGVVWTDVTQGILLLGGGFVSILFLLFSGTAGPSEVLGTAYEAGKFKVADFSFDWNTISVYVMLAFGLNLYMAKYSTDQTVVQRYLLSPNEKEAGKSLWVSLAFMAAVWVIFINIGALLWAFYEVHPGLLPDTVRAEPDAVFAYFIGHQLPPGLTGLILAGLFAASMSTLSSDLNSLGSVVVDDFYNKIKKNATDTQRLRFSRASVLVSGIIGIFLAIALTRVQSIVDAAFWFASIMAGGMMGMFFVGLFTQRCSKPGLYAGLVVGVTFIVWATLTSPMDPNVATWYPKFSIHMFWLGPLGNIVVFVAAYLFSLVLTPGYVAPEGLTIYGKPRTGPAPEVLQRKEAAEDAS